MTGDTIFTLIFLFGIILFLFTAMAMLFIPNKRSGEFRVGETVFLSTRGYCPAVILDVYSRCDKDMGWDRLLIRTENGEEFVTVARNLRR